MTTNYTIELSTEALSVIGEALGNAPLPYKLVAPVIADLQRQITMQDANRSSNVTPIRPATAEVTDTLTASGA